MGRQQGSTVIVCSCNVLSDRVIRDAVDRNAGCAHPANRIYHSLGYKPQCGRCVRSIKGIIVQELADIAARNDARTTQTCCATGDCSDDFLDAPMLQAAE